MDIETNTKVRAKEALISSSFFNIKESQNTSLTTETIIKVREFFNEKTEHRLIFPLSVDSVSRQLKVDRLS